MCATEVHEVRSEAGCCADGPGLGVALREAAPQPAARRRTDGVQSRRPGLGEAGPPALLTELVAVDRLPPVRAEALDATGMPPTPAIPVHAMASKPAADVAA